MITISYIFNSFSKPLPIFLFYNPCHNIFTAHYHWTRIQNEHHRSESSTWMTLLDKVSIKSDWAGGIIVNWFLMGVWTGYGHWVTKSTSQSTSRNEIQKRCGSVFFFGSCFSQYGRVWDLLIGREAGNGGSGLVELRGGATPYLGTKRTPWGSLVVDLPGCPIFTCRQHIVSENILKTSDLLWILITDRGLRSDSKSLPILRYEIKCRLSWWLLLRLNLLRILGIFDLGGGGLF